MITLVLTFWYLAGTLILNWYEEDVLRQTTGERRALGHGHVSKNHDDLFRKTGDELQHVYEKSAAGGDQTFDRLFGRRRQPSYATEQQEKYNWIQNQYLICLLKIRWSSSFKDKHRKKGSIDWTTGTCPFSASSIYICIVFEPNRQWTKPQKSRGRKNTQWTQFYHHV